MFGGYPEFCFCLLLLLSLLFGIEQRQFSDDGDIELAQSYMLKSNGVERTRDLAAEYASKVKMRVVTVCEHFSISTESNVCCFGPGGVLSLTFRMWYLSNVCKPESVRCRGSQFTLRAVWCCLVLSN